MGENIVYLGDGPEHKELSNLVHAESTEPKSMQDHAAAYKEIMLDENTGKYYKCINPSGSIAVANPTSDFELFSMKVTSEKVESLYPLSCELSYNISDSQVVITRDEIANFIKTKLNLSDTLISKIIDSAYMFSLKIVNKYSINFVRIEFATDSYEVKSIGVHYLNFNVSDDKFYISSTINTGQIISISLAI